MTTYAVSFKPSAEKEFLALDGATQKRVAKKIDALATEPRPSGSQKLAGFEALYRVRVGTYRIIYEVNGNEVTVLVLRIGHRREVYRDL